MQELLAGPVYKSAASLFSTLASEKDNLPDFFSDSLSYAVGISECVGDKDVDQECRPNACENVVQGVDSPLLPAPDGFDKLMSTSSSEG